MLSRDAMHDQKAFLQWARGLRWAGGYTYGTLTWQESKRIARERIGVFVNLCWSPTTYRKKLWPMVNDDLVALKMAKLQGNTLDTQIVLSAFATAKRKQHERRWQFKVIRVDMPDEKGETAMWFFRHNGQLGMLTDKYQLTQRKIED